MPNTPPPSSDPTRSDLPEEIGAAIEGLDRAAQAHGWQQHQDDRINARFAAGSHKQARATVTAAILSRLNAVEAERDAALARVERMEKALEDPVSVHVNMLRGTIAKPSLENIIHLYGSEALREAFASPVLVERI